jgi:hypothetical protein
MTPAQRACKDATGHLFVRISARLEECSLCGMYRTAIKAIPKPDKPRDLEIVPSGILTTSAASRFGIRRGTLRTWVRRGLVKEVSRGRLDEKSLLAFLQEIDYRLDGEGNPQWNQAHYAKGFGRSSSPMKNYHHIE